MRTTFSRLISVVWLFYLSQLANLKLVHNQQIQAKILSEEIRSIHIRLISTNSSQNNQINGQKLAEFEKNLRHFYLVYLLDEHKLDLNDQFGYYFNFEYKIYDANKLANCTIICKIDTIQNSQVESCSSLLETLLIHRVSLQKLLNIIIEEITNEERSSSFQLPIWAYVVIAVAGLIILIIFSLILAYILDKKRKNKNLSEDKNYLEMYNNLSISELNLNDSATQNNANAGRYQNRQQNAHDRSTELTLNPKMAKLQISPDTNNHHNNLLKQVNLDEDFDLDEEDYRIPDDEQITTRNTLANKKISNIESQFSEASRFSVNPNNQSSADSNTSNWNLNSPRRVNASEGLAENARFSRLRKKNVDSFRNNKVHF